MYHSEVIYLTIILRYKVPRTSLSVTVHNAIGTYIEHAVMYCWKPVLLEMHQVAVNS